MPPEVRTLATQLLLVSRASRATATEARTAAAPAALALPPAVEATQPHRRPLGIGALAALHLLAALPVAWLAQATREWALLPVAGVALLLAVGFWTGRRTAWLGAFVVHGVLVAAAAFLFAFSARRSYYGAEWFALVGLVAGGVVWYLMTHRAVAWFHLERGT